MSKYEQQSIMSLHRVQADADASARRIFNAIRGHLGEFGRVAPIGRNGLAQLIAIVADPNDNTLPDDVRAAVAMLAVQLRIVNDQILELDRRVRASARATDVGRRLMEVPSHQAARLALSSRQFQIQRLSSPDRKFLATSNPFVPRQNSSGGKERLGGITQARWR